MANELPVIALAELAAIFRDVDARYLIGGSTGLALRGAELDRAPRDLDLYADGPEIEAVHAKLTDYCLDAPEPDETERYRSILSHYTIGDTMIELVGDFCVRARGSVYRTEVNELLYPDCDWIALDGATMPVVPLGHELIFNLLRERQDRARVAGRLIAENPSRHMPILKKLLSRNRLAASIEAEALALADVRLPERDGL
jgi:hypothetical protein